MDLADFAKAKKNIKTKYHCGLVANGEKQELWVVTTEVYPNDMPVCIKCEQHDEIIRLSDNGEVCVWLWEMGYDAPILLRNCLKDNPTMFFWKGQIIRDVLLYDFINGSVSYIDKFSKSIVKLVDLLEALMQYMSIP